MKQLVALRLVLTGCVLTGGVLTGSVLTGCALAPSPAISTPQAVAVQQAVAVHSPIWTGRGSAAGRAGIRACLDRERPDGDPASCRPSLARGNSAFSSAGQDRISNWAVIDDWEGEMTATLAWLRANGPADEVDASQQAWEASMLADVSIYMNMYEGGSLAGLVGSIARAEAVMDRVVFLEKLRRQIETE